MRKSFGGDTDSDHESANDFSLDSEYRRPYANAQPANDFLRQLALDAERSDSTHTRTETRSSFHLDQEPPNLESVSLDDSSRHSRRSASKITRILLRFALLLSALFLFFPLVIFFAVLLDETVLDDLHKSSKLSAFIPYGAYALLFLASHVLLLARQRFQPIRARTPALICVSSVAGFLLISWICFATVLDSENFVRCRVLHALFTVTYPLYVLPYYLRAFRLWYCFRMNVETFSGDTLFTQSRYRLTQPFLLKCLAVLMVPFVVLSVVGGVEHIVFFPIAPGVCGTPVRTFSIFWISVHVTETFLFILSCFALRRVWDQYSIREELLVASVVTGLFTAALTAFQVAHINDNVTEAVGMLMVSRAVALFVVSVLWPVYRSYFPASVVTSLPTRDVLGSLDQVLQDPLCFQYFRQYVVGELNADSLKFWTEIELFRETTDPEDRTKTAERLISTYVVSRRTPLSPIVLGGLAAARRSNAVNGVGADPRMFDDAQAEVYSLLEESYARFLRSATCRDLVAEIGKQEQVVGRLIHNSVL